MFRMSGTDGERSSGLIPQFGGEWRHEMKNILLLVHDDAGQEARLQVALDVTRALNGHLTCVDVAQVPIILASAYDSSGYAIAMDYECQAEGRNRKALEERLAGEGV